MPSPLASRTLDPQPTTLRPTAFNIIEPNSPLTCSYPVFFESARRAPLAAGRPLTPTAAMAPPAPITHGKKERKGLKLTSSFSSARLGGDGDSTSKLFLSFPPVIMLSIRAVLPQGASTRALNYLPSCAYVSLILGLTSIRASSPKVRQRSRHLPPSSESIHFFRTDR